MVVEITAETGDMRLKICLPFVQQWLPNTTKDKTQKKLFQMQSHECTGIKTHTGVLDDCHKRYK